MPIRPNGYARGRATPIQLQMLDYLCRCNRYSDTLAAVGCYFYLTKGTVSQSLNVLARLLRGLQHANDRRGFGVCHTCRHHREEGAGRFRCGLTGESLATIEIDQICVDHEDLPSQEKPTPSL